MIRFPYGVKERRPCPSGSRIGYRKVKTTNDCGECCLMVVEEFDLQDQINSFKDFCLIENIVRRYMGGDTSALNMSPGVFMDTIGLPHDMIEAQHHLARARDLYARMPADLKDGIAGGFDGFVRSLGTKDGLDAFYKRVYEAKAKKGGEHA